MQIYDKDGVRTKRADVPRMVLGLFVVLVSLYLGFLLKSVLPLEEVWHAFLVMIIGFIDVLLYGILIDDNLWYRR